MSPVILAALLAQPSAVACVPGPQLYIAPMGEPVRAPADAPYPSAAWFGTVDTDRDGRLTLPEFVVDADRFFARLDGNHDGEIDPAEMIDYETRLVPEIRLYQPGPPPGRKRSPSKRDLGYGGALGAGRWAQLNLPEPVAAADLDFNGGVYLSEWRTVAARRFALLGPTGGALTLAGLAHTPAQDEVIACAQAMARQPKRR